MRGLRLTPAIMILAVGSGFAQTPAQPQALIVGAATAAKSGEERLDTIAPGAYTVTALDLLPSAQYELSWWVLPIWRDAIPKPDLKGLVGTPAPPSACDKLELKRLELMTLKEESAVPGKKAELVTLRAESTSDGSPTCTQILRATDTALARTSMRHETVVNLQEGEYVRVRLIRYEDGAPTRTFQWRFVAPGGGKWVTTYGMNAAVLVGGDDTKPHFIEDENETLTLRPRERRAPIDPNIAVTYTWLRSPRGLQWTPLTGGLGLDWSLNPAVYLGTGAALQSNLFFSIGAVLKRFEMLNSRYSSGDVVESQLSDDQINEKIWNVRPYVGLSWRFDGNPFGKSGDEKSKEAQPKSGDSSKDKQGGTGGPAPASEGSAPK